MKQKYLIFIPLLLAFILAACMYVGSEDSPSKRPPDGGYYGPWQGGYYPRPNPGQLTAGEWSDIKNYDFYLGLFKAPDKSNSEDNQEQRNFSQFIKYFGFETRYMVTVNVVDGSDLPVADADVELYNEGQSILFAAKTDVRGNAYMFPPNNLNGETISVKAKSGGNDFESSGSFIYNPQNNVKIALANSAPAEAVLDLMFVIDTTGSMGDELNYLQGEISDVIGKIRNANAAYTINLALLFYRDIGDEYVTRYFDFTTNIPVQRQNLARQYAGGGKDFPEAVDRALSEAVGKNWSSGSATRLIFHVCDAPPHDTKEKKALYYDSIKIAAQKGIRIIPVASSGINIATEYLLRQEALMTGGTYIFLTDDSGIGGSHLEPTIGEYIVEYLNACLIRIVNEYLTGEAEEPVPYYD